jgi:hypothetical protein
MEDSPEAMSPEPKAPSSPRRRFLQHGLAGGSVALLASTHRALAGGSCGLSSMSGYQSAMANPATSAGAAHFCPGRSPGYWAPPGNTANHFSEWPSGYVPTGPQATTFISVFGTAPGYGFPNNATLCTVVSTPPDTPARQFVGALLDAASNMPNYPYTVSQIVQIWQTTSSAEKDAYNTYFSTYLNVA